MSFGFISPITLSDRTRAAWKNAGGVPMRFRETAEEWATSPAASMDFFLNLGHRQLVLPDWDIPVINAPHTVGALMYPESVRSKLPELAVPRPDNFEEPQVVWIKPPGYAGRGKRKVLTERALVLPEDWDWQLHISGTEYRVITVGRRAVQGFIREGDNGDRDYGWTGLAHTPEDVLSVARKAARHFEESGYTNPHNTVYAWDLILSDTGRVYLFEGNTCPGMSDPTAERIVNEVQRQLEEGRIQ